MDWDRRYQTGNIPWEKGAPAPPLLEWLQACGPLHGNILVPGCGYGHDVRAIAAASPESKVIGLDISPLAIERARQYPVIGREAYELEISLTFRRIFPGSFSGHLSIPAFAQLILSGGLTMSARLPAHLDRTVCCLRSFISIRGAKGKNPPKVVLLSACRFRNSISFLALFLTRLMKGVLATLFRGAKAGKSSGCFAKGEPGALKDCF